MQFTLVPAVAGILGTVAYLVFQLLPRQLGIAHLDVVRAVGSFVTKDREKAFVPGFILSFVLGIIMAYVYYAMISYIRGIPANALSGLFFGLVQGAVFMLYTVVMVMEHHPDKRYQRRGPMTGLMQLASNGVFGLVVGAVCAYYPPIH